MKAQDFMTAAPITVTAETTVEEAAAKMKEHDIGALPVYGAGSPCGIVTDRDIALRVVAAGKDAATQVGEICAISAVTVNPDTDIDEVAQVMHKYQIRRLPVVEGNKLKGMISLADVSRAQQQLAGKALAGISQPNPPLAESDCCLGEFF